MTDETIHPGSDDPMAKKDLVAEDAVTGPESGPKDETIANPVNEIIKQSQELYDWLGFEIDLQAELEAGNVILLSPEQQKAAANAGYTLSLVIPSNIPREVIIEKLNKKLVELGESAPDDDHMFDVLAESGIFPGDYSDWIDTGNSLMSTPVITNHLRPAKSYVCSIKPIVSAHEAFPETIAKSPEDNLHILETTRAENDKLNLHGVTFEEYIFSCLRYYMDTGELIDADAAPSETYLLEETFEGPERVGSTEKKLFCIKGVGPFEIGFFRMSGDGGVRKGTRFVVLPENIS